MGEQSTTTESIIMAALSTLTPSQLSALSNSLCSTFHRHQRRLASLLSSPTLFTHTLNHLYSLSLSQKSLLIARHLHSFLQLLSPFFFPNYPSYYNHRFCLRDLDSVLLLLFFCEIRQCHPTALETSHLYWHEILVDYYSSDTMVRLSRLLVSSFEVLGTFIDIVVKCRKFVSTRGCCNDLPRQVAASAAAVVALPSVEVKKRHGVCLEYCVICREQFREGMDVCALPCKHLFHWNCVLHWLRKNNTCPCCRFQLPTDDVYEDIQRLWNVIVKHSHLSSDMSYFG